MKPKPAAREGPRKGTSHKGRERPHIEEEEEEEKEDVVVKENSVSCPLSELWQRVPLEM